jgi:hypothetical protein
MWWAKLKTWGVFIRDDRQESFSHTTGIKSLRMKREIKTYLIWPIKDGEKLRFKTLYDEKGERIRKKERRKCKLSLAQLISFFMVEPIYLGLNLIFNMSVVFIINYSFSGKWHFCWQWDVLGDPLHKSPD